MAAVALGKRTRSSSFSAPTPRPTRQRKTVKILDEDEMGDTIILKTTDSSPAPPSTPKRTRRTAASAAKAADARSPLTPQKVTNVFKASKPATTPRSGIENLKIGSPQSQKIVIEPRTPSRREKVAVKPTTPRHRVQLVGKPVTPKSRLFGTPTQTVPTTVITTAKALFTRSTTGGKIIGRDDERKKLTDFIADCLDNKKGGCLYVSGPPGCGKSALLAEITDKLVPEDDKDTSKASINCMSLSTPTQIYASLLTAFDIPPPRAPTLTDLEHLFLDSPTQFLLILDEIDHLPPATLCALFALSLRPTSSLCLIGIANALDLTDRFLPQLKSRNLEPQLLPFLPYTAAQISTVLTTKLKTLLPKDAKDPTYLPFAHPAALSLLGKKVEAASGDLRKAFDIMRRSLELLELEHLRPSAPLSPTSSNKPSALPSWTVETAPRVSLPHVAKAAATALGSSLSTRVAALNAHQKAVLCILVARAGTQPWGFVKLREAYEKACKEGGSVKMMPLVGQEFRAVVEGLESAGMVEVIGIGQATPRKKGASEEKVCARVGKMELVTALGGEKGGGREGLLAILGA